MATLGHLLEKEGIMPTKITLIVDNPANPDVFEEAYAEVRQAAVDAAEAPAGRVGQGVAEGGRLGRHPLTERSTSTSTATRTPPPRSPRPPPLRCSVGSPETQVTFTGLFSDIEQ